MTTKRLCWTVVLCGIASGQISEISGERIRAHVRFLASDLLEGRGVGTRGGDLAAEYIASQFALVGAKPGGEGGTYFQRVPLVGVSTQPQARLTASARAGQAVTFEWMKDFVGVTEQQRGDVRLDAEAVFVGHGIVAPEYDWNDFQGVDVKGKVLVLFTNEPPSSDPAFFGGKSLTYYGRWTYKYEQAARMGAVGALIIHTTPTAGYGYAVVQGSWGKEDPQIRRQEGSGLAFAGWLSEEAGGRLLRLAGKSVDELLQAANSRNFRAMPLGIRVRGNLPTKVRSLASRNVVGVVAGSDPKLKDEAVVLTAHWDHLGIGPEVNGDRIYNGAVDNATGCGVLIEMARAWAGLRQKPRRSAIFVAVTAEEAGDLGADYYGAHPLIPLGKTALNLNFDSYYPFGATKDVFVTGAERTTVWPAVEEAARRMGIAIKPDPHPEQGLFYRSDHFSFAKLGVPAFSVDLGVEYYGKAPGFGAMIFEEYNDKHYHAPSDEYREDWDFAGMEEAAKFGFLIGTTVANQEKLPEWKPGDEFFEVRRKSLGK